ncbi:mechanosensitive ion channel [Oscillatoria sp. FACHB-1407]|uniref:mechanosensitive ion channel family protein n=1 Tax=Oscillatoria sp. FACHB-1407 TaxID=2692847 RepID=UPI001688CB98|nr:mechanosensitive ion channel domain-containing protein [Oscillatoria sp. FACHB-1407]MBD2460819.1 mechanosensitive ion channel [Oscillatoria sp. FACHB-1407]
MSHVPSRQSFQFALFQAIALPLILTIVVWLTPALAKGTSTSAVVVDGAVLFRVEATPELTASDRAAVINATLQDLVRSPASVEVEVVERNQAPTIVVNDRYLLTVTQQDVAPGSTPTQQAGGWARQIQEAVQQAQYYRSSRYLQTALLIAAAIVAIALGLHWGLGWLWRHSLIPAVQRLLPPPPDEGAELPNPVNLLLKGLLAIARFALWIAVLFYVSRLFPVTRYWSYEIGEILISSFTSPILTLGNSQYSITNLIILATMLLGLIIFSRTFTDFLKSRILQRTGVNRGAQEAVAIVLRYGLIFIGSLVLLQVWGLDISSLAILASALSVGIGFGLQDIAKNFGSGLVLVFERPIQVGDFVEVGDFQGTVERIGARSTLIRTLDQVSIIVPNSRFLEQEVINWSHDNPISRIHIPVGVAYNSDVEMVRSLLLEAASSHQRVLSTPQPQVFFIGFGDSSLDFELLVWTAEPSKQLPLKSDLYFQIEALLRQHQIEVPFPQRDLYIRAERLPIEFSPQVEQALQQLMNGRLKDEG